MFRDQETAPTGVAFGDDGGTLSLSTSTGVLSTSRAVLSLTVPLLHNHGAEPLPSRVKERICVRPSTLQRGLSNHRCNDWAAPAAGGRSSLAGCLVAGGSRCALVSTLSVLLMQPMRAARRALQSAASARQRRAGYISPPSPFHASVNAPSGSVASMPGS